MPFPLAIPLLIKGGIVAAKFIASKHAAVTVAKGAIVATKTLGAATTVGLAANGLIVVGGITWTLERFNMGKRALSLFDDGDWLGAANELTRIARSVYQVEGSAFVDEVSGWVKNGAHVDDPAFKGIISDLRQIVDEANQTRNTVNT